MLFFIIFFILLLYAGVFLRKNFSVRFGCIEKCKYGAVQTVKILNIFMNLNSYVFFVHEMVSNVNYCIIVPSIHIVIM